MRIIAGKFSSRVIATPKGNKTRPTADSLRETVFNIIGPKIEEKTFLDLCAGSGAMGLEALSRGASHAFFVESSRKAAKVIQGNIDLLQVKEQSSLFVQHASLALTHLAKTNKKFSFIYIDPPYGLEEKGQLLSERCLHYVDAHGLLEEGGLLFIEEASSPKKLDIKENLELSSLRLVKEKEQGNSRLRYYTLSSN